MIASQDSVDWKLSDGAPVCGRESIYSGRACRRGDLSHYLPLRTGGPDLRPAAYLSVPTLRMGFVARISEALGPPKGSRSTRTKFVRSPRGLKGILRRRWSSQQYYLGEWHFHPQGRGCPSPQDQRQLAEIGSDGAYACPNPILMVVGGCSNDWRIGVWVFADGQLLWLRRVSQTTQSDDALRPGSGLHSD